MSQPTKVGLYPASARLLACLLATTCGLAQGRAVHEPRDTVALGRLRLVRTAEGGRQLHLPGTRNSPALTVDLPLRVVTAVAEVAGGFLVAGVTASGACPVLAVQCTGGQLALADARLLVQTHPVAVDMRHGLMALWLHDGRLFVSPWEDLAALPRFEDFELAGTQAYVDPTAGLTVLPNGKLSLGVGMGQRTTLQRTASGTWERVQPESSNRTSGFSVQQPARVGAPIELRGANSRYAVLEEQASGWSLPVLLEPTPLGTMVLSPEVTRSLRADCRYRLHAVNQASSWFHPAAIRGAAWSNSGVELGELLVAEGFVTQERGAPTFHTSVHTPLGFAATKLLTVCLLTISHDPVPPVVERNGHTWLQPMRIATREQECQPRQRQHALAASVPIQRTEGAIGSWLHVQFALLDQDHRLLGATGVRSVPVLPDSGRFRPDQEERLRAWADRFWEQQRVEPIQSYWEALVATR